MPRNVINRSISFDPQIFGQMETRRGKLLMDRSEYVKRCIMKDMMAGGDMTLTEVPVEFVSALVTQTSRLGVRDKRKKRSRK